MNLKSGLGLKNFNGNNNKLSVPQGLVFMDNFIFLNYVIEVSLIQDFTQKIFEEHD
jgi:hypothetical protein